MCHIVLQTFVMLAFNLLKLEIGGYFTMDFQALVRGYWECLSKIGDNLTTGDVSNIQWFSFIDISHSYLMI